MMIEMIIAKIKTFFTKKVLLNEANTIETPKIESCIDFVPKVEIKIDEYEYYNYRIENGEIDLNLLSEEELNKICRIFKNKFEENQLNLQNMLISSDFDA